MSTIVATVICPSTGKKFQAELKVIDKAENTDSPFVQKFFWKGSEHGEERKDIMLNHNIKLQVQLSDYVQGDSIELTIKQSNGRRIKGHSTEFKISGTCDENGLVIIDNFKVECDFKEDNQNFGNIEFYHKDRKVKEFKENFGWTWVKIGVLLHIFVNVEWDAGCIADGCTEKDYKDAINNQFKRTLELSSGGLVTGRIFFDGYCTLDLPQATVKLSTNKKPPKPDDPTKAVVVGGTMWNSSSIGSDETEKDDTLLDVAVTAIHELFHTLRLDHPFNRVVSEDSRLKHVGGLYFESTSQTDKKIQYNIMNYNFIYIDGVLLKDLWKYKRPEYLTKGQIQFIFNQIDSQQKGDGAKKIYYNYIEYWNEYPCIEEIK